MMALPNEASSTRSPSSRALGCSSEDTDLSVPVTVLTLEALWSIHFTVHLSLTLPVDRFSETLARGEPCPAQPRRETTRSHSSAYSIVKMSPG